MLEAKRPPLRLGRISGRSLLHIFEATRSFATMVMAQDFYAAFGHDGLGQIGSETTINSGDLAGILMIAVEALEKRTGELKQKERRWLYWNRG